MIARKRDGSIVEVYDGEGKVIEFLYGNALGRKGLSLLIAPWVSKLAGAFLDCRISAILISPFIHKNHLDLSDYPSRKYSSFNDFFTRTIIPDRRPVDPDPNRLIAPCDGKLTIIPLEADAHFKIKGCDYTLNSLLRRDTLASRYQGGTGLLFRLSVDDYHRYTYPVSGKKGKNFHIKGVFHTVNPRAAEARPIYQENSREYTRIQTSSSGQILMMEIGAMLVGRIKNHHGPSQVTRGEEKGCFEYGGSSILLLLEKDCFVPDADLVQNSAEGYETIVRCGEAIGDLQKRF